MPDPSLAKLEAMVGEGKCDYHVIELEGANYMLAVEKGLLQEIDYSIVDPNNVMEQSNQNLVKNFNLKKVA